MAGLHLYCRYDGDTAAAEANTREALADGGPAGDVIRVFYQGNGAALAFRGFSDYPVEDCSADGFRVFLEGRIYGLSEDRRRNEVREAAQAMLAASPDAEALGRWLQGTDGEFVVWAVEEASGRITVLGSLFGALPVYWTAGLEGAVVSRRIRFPRKIVRPSVDSLGLAQRLAYGHGLAGRTIWENIRLLPPAGMAVVDPARRMAHVQTIYAYDFGAKDSFLPIEAHVDRLADLFVQACRVRAMVPGPHVLSLSGGMDSRTVAAGLTRAGAAFHGRTFAKAGYTTDREAELAQRVAQTLNRPWKLVQVPGMTARAAHDLLIWRGGRNVLWMSFILAFYQALRDEFGPGVVGYTGDGGDFALPDMRPARTILSLEGLGDYIGDYGYITNYCLKTEDAAKLAGIPLEKLTHSVLDHLKIYPMDQWNTAFIHYIFVDNIPHIYHEGLDRNRMFFWHTSPFFAPAFLGAALRVPWPMKAGYRLYQKVLERLSPEAARIEYGNHPLGSLSFRWHYFQYRLKKGHPRLAKWLKHRIKGEDVYAENSDLVRIVRHQIQSRPSLAGAMDAPFLKKLVHPSAMYNKFNVLSLFTVVADLEEGLSGHSMLEEEADAVLL